MLSDELFSNHWAVATAALVLTALVSAFAERRRLNRKNLEKVGLMPWNAILMLSLVLAAFTGGIAVKAAFL